jgi:hypothetical protein
MKDNQTPREELHLPRDASQQKKIYKKPAFRYERVFETLALACGKTGSTNPTCQFSRKTS